MDSNIDMDYESNNSSTGGDVTGLEPPFSGTLVAQENDGMHQGLTLADYSLMFGSSSEVSNRRRLSSFVVVAWLVCLPCTPWRARTPSPRTEMAPLGASVPNTVSAWLFLFFRGVFNSFVLQGSVACHVGRP